MCRAGRSTDVLCALLWCAAPALQPPPLAAAVLYSVIFTFIRTVHFSTVHCTLDTSKNMPLIGLNIDIFSKLSKARTFS